MAAYYLWPQSKKPLNPQSYSEHAISSNERISPKHVVLGVPVSPSELPQFAQDAVTLRGQHPAPGEVVVQHVMVKNPALMIERPYTPINDVAAEGEMKMVVKRVRGGEVGR